LSQSIYIDAKDAIWNEKHKNFTVIKIAVTSKIISKQYLALTEEVPILIKARKYNRIQGV
jgi:hypothetical protein